MVSLTVFVGQLVKKRYAEGFISGGADNRSLSRQYRILQGSVAMDALEDDLEQVFVGRDEIGNEEERHTCGREPGLGTFDWIVRDLMDIVIPLQRSEQDLFLPG